MADIDIKKIEAIDIPGSDVQAVRRDDLGVENAFYLAATPDQPARLFQISFQDGNISIKNITTMARMRLLEAHIRLASSVVNATERRRLSNNLDPLDFRASKFPLDDDFGAIVERFAAQVPDVKGNIGTPHKIYDTLAILRRNDSIDDDELKAGRTFEETFRMANLDPLKATNMERVSGNSSSSISEAIRDNRRVLLSTLEVIGDGNWLSQKPSSLWCILGLGCTIKEWGIRCQQRYGSSLSQKSAKRVFVSALETLSELWFDGAPLHLRSRRGARRLNGAEKGVDDQKRREQKEYDVIVIPGDSVRVTFPGGTLTLDEDGERL